jgi:hypothetical protein
MRFKVAMDLIISGFAKIVECNEVLLAGLVQVQTKREKGDKRSGKRVGVVWFTIGLGS